MHSHSTSRVAVAVQAETKPAETPRGWLMVTTLRKMEAACVTAAETAVVGAVGAEQVGLRDMTVTDTVATWMEAAAVPSAMEIAAAAVLAERKDILTAHVENQRSGSSHC